ncbi:hypothetical protein J5M86_01010 [Yimella sp. cx-51]|uniref:hypothetical protein n=1 Tax=Yimella sp. cx-51 TaxID=2770551 RepID=UPI001AD8547C|nr:hypothetical protein [Yimella sp. cx-51]QTH38306.1 hypothetical protein J5M86_01010 [Yimella sp. cx-51]
MATRIPVPSEPFAVADARRAGLSTDRLRGRDLASPFRGIRAAAAPTTALEAVHAYAPRLLDGHVFGGASAAAVWGLPVPHRMTGAESVVVVLRKSRTRTIVRGITTREVKPGLFDEVQLDGLRVTGPLLTWCVLARECSVDELVRVGDAMVSTNTDYVGRHPWFEPVSITQLRDAAVKWKGCVGVEKLRVAATLVRDAVASPPETDLRLVLDHAGLPEPEVNVDLWREDGTFLARPDLLFRDVRLIFEYEGDGHRTDLKQFRRDITRTGELESENYTVVRVTGDDLYRQTSSFRERARRSYELAVRRSALESA